MTDAARQEIIYDKLPAMMPIFLWGLSLFCLCLSGYYWVRLIGAFPGPLWRFDLMPWNWRVLCAALAVLYPVAACGLWMRSQWGVILWLVGGLVEAVCFTVYSSYFSFNLAIPFLHTVFFVIYVILRVLGYMQQRKEKDIVAEY